MDEEYKRIDSLYEFLHNKSTQKNIFSLDDIIEHTHYAESSIRTYYSKRLRPYMKLKGNKIELDCNKFAKKFDNKNAFREYMCQIYDNVKKKQ